MTSDKIHTKVLSSQNVTTAIGVIIAVCRTIAKPRPEIYVI